MSSDEDKQEFKYGYVYSVSVSADDYRSEQDAEEDLKDDYFGDLALSETENGTIRLIFKGTFRFEETPGNADERAEKTLREESSGAVDIKDLSQLRS